MDASVFKSLPFFFASSFSDVATTASGTSGQESVSVFSTDRAQFVGWVKRRLGVKSLWCGDLFSGTVTELRLKELF